MKVPPIHGHDDCRVRAGSEPPLDEGRPPVRMTFYDDEHLRLIDYN
ncbi:MAG TPA: hypothetical protein VK856_13225 [Anaerolineaceae bacterium]|nr:hypothetical protein [Anaerolineaceae bacterium]